MIDSVYKPASFTLYQPLLVELERIVKSPEKLAWFDDPGYHRKFAQAVGRYITAADITRIHKHLSRMADKDRVRRDALKPW